MIRSEIFVAFDERFSPPERGRRCHLRSTSSPPASPLSLLPPTPLGLLPPEYENTLSLHKSLPQLQFISLFFLAVFSVGGRWDFDMKWNYWSYQCKMAKLAQTKAICLYSPGKSESSLIILQLELILGPCLSLSPWEPDTMYYRALRIPNTYTNPWCRLLIDLHVRWRTQAQTKAARA